MCVNFVHATNSANHYATPQTNLCAVQKRMNRSRCRLGRLASDGVYDTRCYFNMQSQADTSQLRIYRTEPTTKKWKTDKLKSKKTDMLKSIGKHCGVSVESRAAVGTEFLSPYPSHAHRKFCGYPHSIPIPTEPQNPTYPYPHPVFLL